MNNLTCNYCALSITVFTEHVCVEMLRRRKGTSVNTSAYFNNDIKHPYAFKKCLTCGVEQWIQKRRDFCSRTCSKLGELNPSTREHPRPSDSTARYCPDCDDQVPAILFSLNKGTKSGYGVYCRKHSGIRSLASVERIYGSSLVKWRIRNYGLSESDVQTMLEVVNFQCPGCGNSIDSATAHVDHDHNCCLVNPTCGKCIRGLLCNNCNFALGNVKDNTETLSNLIEYLRKHGK